MKIIIFVVTSYQTSSMMKVESSLYPMTIKAILVILCYNNNALGINSSVWYKYHSLCMVCTYIFDLVRPRGFRVIHKSIFVFFNIILPNFNFD